MVREGHVKVLGALLSPLVVLWGLRVAYVRFQLQRLRERRRGGAQDG